MLRDDKNFDKNSSLDFAVNSLNTSVEQEKRARTFAINQRAIEKIGRALPSQTTGNLQIHPSIRGEADHQPAQPMIMGDSFSIDLSKMRVPAQCGSETIQELIQRLCGQHRINMHRTPMTATFTPVATALAGQYADDDASFSGSTKAEFVPVYHSPNAEQRVLAISYSLNGETGVKVDVMLVKDKMTCLGRQTSSTTTAMRAIELPNELAMEMRDQQPALFEQLQKSSSLVIFVNFNVEQPYSSLRYAQPVLMGMGGGNTRGGATEGMYAHDANSKGLSAYSVVGEGSGAKDHSHTVLETGIRTLTGIQVFCVGAMVVNTKKQELTNGQVVNAVQMLQMRAQELGRMYESCKVVTYSHLQVKLSQLLTEYRVTTSSSDIFEHAMLKLAGITEIPSACHFRPSQTAPDKFEMRLGLSDESMRMLETSLRARYGTDYCRYNPNEYAENVGLIRFSLANVLQNITDIQANMDAILSVPRNLLAYQKYSGGELLPFLNQPGSLFYTYVAIAAQAGISLQKADLFEIIFLKMFGCEEELHHARFKPGPDYVGRMLDTHFYLDISESAARKVVERINADFPQTSPSTDAHARFVRTDARIKKIGDIDLREFVFDSSIIKSREFYQRFVDILNKLIEAQPLLIEKMRIQSNPQTNSSEKLAAQLLNDISKKISSDATTSADPIRLGRQVLSNSLTFFASVLTDPTKTMTDRCEASDKVRRSIGYFGSTQVAADNKTFKKGLKKEIKAVQAYLGLRK